MHFEKTTCELYRIFNDGEWATIALTVYPERSDNGRAIYGGELLVHSSFGNFAHGWSTCGVPFKEFLARLNYAYLMGKLMGTDAKVYDRETTYTNVLFRLHELVSEGTYSERDREILTNALEEDVNGANGTEHQFIHAMSELDPDDLEGEITNLTDDAHEYLATKANPQAIGFWKELWPTFTAALRQETAAQAA